MPVTESYVVLAGECAFDVQVGGRKPHLQSPPGTVDLYTRTEVTP